MKNSYLARLADPLPGSNTLFTNHRHKFFCECGNSYEIKHLEYNKYNKIVCIFCNNEVSYVKMSIKQIENVINKKIRLFENETFLNLVLFEKFIGVNLKTKKLYYKTTKFKVTYNKVTNRFFIYDDSKKNKLSSLPLNRIIDYFNNITNLIYEKEIKKCFNENGDNIIVNFERDFNKPLNDFILRLQDFINKKDINKVNKIIKQEKEKIDNSKKSTFDIRNVECKKNKITLEILISLIQYENLSSILFYKGYDFYSHLLNKSSSVYYFKKYKSTSPKDIINNFYIQKIEYLNRYYLTRKRELEKNIKINESNNYNYMINQMNNELTYLKDVKVKIKNIKLPNFIIKNLTTENFDILRVYYISLLSENFNINWLNDKFLKQQAKIYNFLNIFYQFKDVLSDYKLDFYDNQDYKLNHNFFEKLFKLYLNVSEQENFNSYIFLDTIRFVIDRNYDINNLFKIKTFDKVVELHEELQMLFNLEKNEKFNEEIKKNLKKYKFLKNVNYENINFKLIDNIHDLEEESKVMKHCVRTYAGGMAKGKHLIFSIKDNESEDRATLEFYNIKKTENSEDIWSYNQLYSKYNTQASKKIVNSIEGFSKEIMKKNNIKIKSNKNKNNYNIQNYVFDNEEQNFYVNNLDDLPF